MMNWAAMERSVRHMQARIFKTTQDGDEKRAKHLMKLLARSETAKLLSIYVVTQKNSGKNTPGIDGKVFLKNEDRMALGREVFDYRSWHFQPALRRYIPKAKDHHAPKGTPLKLRPLSIMIIKDRIMTTIVSFALVARWEAVLEPNVFGYRPGRCTQDAAQAIYSVLSRQNMVILDADIKSFFDNVRHDAILTRLTCFKDFVKRSMTAGIVENGQITRPTRGIMQGSPLSPVLANIALHGMESLFGHDRHVYVFRYADDLVILALSERMIQVQVLPRLIRFLGERGLELKAEKTRIVTRKAGFNFLGFNVGKPRLKLFVKPQKEKVLGFLEHIRDIIKSNRQAEQRKLIAQLNWVINGWASYYRYSDANDAFSRVDHEVWKALWQWAKRRHPNKGRRWVANRYFSKVGNRSWVFRDVKTGYTLAAAGNVKREKYTFVVGRLSPLDKSPEAVAAWTRRRYNEIRHAVEFSADGNASLPDGSHILGG
jgi:RNA-directed DNA polymerase